MHKFKNSISFILIFIGLSLPQVKGQDMTRSEYYGVMPFYESPVVSFRGGCPLDEKEISQRVHLKLDYDDQNRVIQAEVRLGSHLKDLEGRLGSLYINSPRVRVVYENNQEKHYFFDRLDNPISVMNDVFVRVYDKDEYGRNVQLTYLSESGEPATNYFGYTRYEWTYNVDGSLTEERFDENGQLGPLRGGFHLLRTKIVYGSDGYPSMLQNIDENGALVNSPSGTATFKYFYNQMGLFDRWEVYDKEGLPSVGPSHTSGEQNVFDGCNLKEIVFFDPEGQPTIHWSGAEKWYMEYDEYGNKTLLGFRDRNNQFMTGNNGYAQTRFNWSDDGRFLLAQRYYDAEGNLTQHQGRGVSQIIYERDHRGLILEEKYLNESGELTPRKDSGISRVINTYDENGRLINTESM